MGLTEAEVKNYMRALFANSVKQGGLNLSDPVVVVPCHRQSSIEGSDVLVKFLRGEASWTLWSTRITPARPSAMHGS